MRIIDAHLHIFPNDRPHPHELAARAGHVNSIAHLREAYASLGMAHGVVMGNRSLEPEYHDYPADLFHYCIGIDSSLLQEGAHGIRDMADKVEANLKRRECCGIKLYPGYNKLWLSDGLYRPVYELAAAYHKPVAVHMGLTSTTQSHLKYCHPLALDEVAADHPEADFVMCHFGNPFLEAAAAVAMKNPNVSIDLSGLLEGRIELESFRREHSGYIFLLKAWLETIGRWDSIMYGTDWPIVNLGEYIAFVKEFVPEAQWEAVFFHNANRIYGLGL